MEQIFNLIEDNNVGFNAVRGEIAFNDENVNLNGFVGDLKEPIVLPVGEKTSWEMTIVGTLPTGRFLNSSPKYKSGVFFGYNDFGYSASVSSLYLGIEIDGIFFYYCWDIQEDKTLGEHIYVYSFDGAKYYLSIDNETPRSFGKLYFSQTDFVETGDGGIASNEVSTKIYAVNGQKYVKMSRIGTDDFKVNFSIKKWIVKTKRLDDYYELTEHTLSGKKIFQLGSSISYGAGSGGLSFVEQIAAVTGSDYVKETVSGTTLAKISNSSVSYVERFENFDFSVGCDVLQTQLSTNDFNNGVNKGTVSPNGVRASSAMDVTTICGAIEYIIAKTKEISPRTVIVFYSCYIKGTWQKYAEYKNFVDKEMNSIVRKWDIVYVDLFNVPKLSYDNYMADAIHPKEVAYAGLFVPNMITAFCDSLS